MLEVQVADGCCTNSHRGAGRDAIKHSRDQNAVPSGTISGSNVGDGRNQISQQVDRSTAVDIRERNNDKGTNAGENDVYGEFYTASLADMLRPPVTPRQWKTRRILTVADLDRGHLKYFSHGHKGWVDHGRAHGPQHGEPADLQSDK